MHTRRATVADASGIATVHVSSWRAIYRGHMPQEVLDSLSVEQRARGWRSLLALPQLETFVAESEHVTGFCNLGPSRDRDAPPDTGEITAIYVDPDSWRQGLGRELLAAAIARAQERGFNSLTLWVLRENEQARSFYQALGFRADGCERTDTALIASPLNEVRYVLACGSQPA
jgi:ribosomal protein S18 acetylase RimI-like enzyme